MIRQQLYFHCITSTLNANVWNYGTLKRCGLFFPEIFQQELAQQENGLEQEPPQQEHDLEWGPPQQENGLEGVYGSTQATIEKIVKRKGRGWSRWISVATHLFQLAQKSFLAILAIYYF